ncbi:hypothetical protein C8Q76DRAFT_696812 [Earliella scabrosa]|nr:hypothetical protein C8Q76DRAFT_696812 [Earliella scabrosa]
MTCNGQRFRWGIHHPHDSYPYFRFEVIQPEPGIVAPTSGVLNSHYVHPSTRLSTEIRQHCYVPAPTTCNHNGAAAPSPSYTDMHMCINPSLLHLGTYPRLDGKHSPSSIDVLHACSVGGADPHPQSFAATGSIATDMRDETQREGSLKAEPASTDLAYADIDVGMVSRSYLAVGFSTTSRYLQSALQVEICSLLSVGHTARAYSKAAETSRRRTSALESSSMASYGRYQLVDNTAGSRSLSLYIITSRRNTARRGSSPSAAHA